MRATCTVLRREWRAFFDTPMGYVFIVFFLTLSCGLFVLLHLFVDGAAELRAYFNYLPFLLAIFSPAIAMRLWAEERKQGTAELLLTLPVRTFQAVAGKFLAAFLFLALTILLTFPLPMALWFLRPEGTAGPDWGPILGGYLGALGLGLVYLAAGAFASSLARDQIVAFVIGLSINAVVLLISAPAIVTVFRDVNEQLAAQVQRFGVYGHFDSLARGVVDTRDILYLLSMCAFFLFLNVLVVERRR